MRIANLPFIFVLAFAPRLFGSLCITDTLSGYIALGATGCQVGSMNVVNFSYSTITSTVTINATDITVTPSAAGGVLTLDFTSPKFNLSGANTAQYLLGYTWDPGDVRGMEDIMSAFSPVYPGYASVTSQACKDAAFVVLFCPTSTATLMVSDNGIAANLLASTTFSPPIGIVGVLNTIELDGNGSTSEIAGFSNVLFTPEPGTFAAGLFVLSLLACRRVRH